MVAIVDIDTYDADWSPPRVIVALAYGNLVVNAMLSKFEESLLAGLMNKLWNELLARNVVPKWACLLYTSPSPRDS